MKIKLLYGTIVLLCISLVASSGEYAGIHKIDTGKKEQVKTAPLVEKTEEADDLQELGAVTHFCLLKI
jgi:hypothetical protein